MFYSASRRLLLPLPAASAFPLNRDNTYRDHTHRGNTHREQTTHIETIHTEQPTEITHTPQHTETTPHTHQYTQPHTRPVPALASSAAPTPLCPSWGSRRPLSCHRRATNAAVFRVQAHRACINRGLVPHS